MAVQEQPPKRSAGSLAGRRTPRPWPEDREFHILSIDGGGIRGIFPAAVLSELEARDPGTSSVARRFDLIAGTSTGGIIALGLGAGLTATKIRDMYVDEGGAIFPLPKFGIAGRLWRQVRRLVLNPYDSGALERQLRLRFGSRTLAESDVRLCVPSCDGTHGDAWVLKTPHHPDYKTDGETEMVAAALATAAAPTFFRPFADGGYDLLDGGLWANNPVMVGLTEALTAFDVPRDRIRILSIGCGTTPYRIGRWQRRLGGMWPWRKIVFGAMHYQSRAALGSAQLLIGTDRVTRLEPPATAKPIALDDWQRARAELPGAAAPAVDALGTEVLGWFLDHQTDPYRPVQQPAGDGPEEMA